MWNNDVIMCKNNYKTRRNSIFHSIFQQINRRFKTRPDPAGPAGTGGRPIRPGRQARLAPLGQQSLLGRQGAIYLRNKLGGVVFKKQWRGKKKSHPGILYDEAVKVKTKVKWRTCSWFFNDIADGDLRGDLRNIAGSFFQSGKSRGKKPAAYYRRSILSQLFLALNIARSTAAEKSSQLFL